MHKPRIHPLVGLLIALLLVTCMPQRAEAAIPVYMWITVKGVPLEGGTDIAGRERSIECQFLDQQILAPVGLSKPEFLPLTCIKPVDDATPRLVKALVEQESLEATIVFYLIDSTGTETPYLTITLRNAHITKYRLVIDDTKDPANERKVHREEITLAYDSITYAFSLQGRSFSYTTGPSPAPPTADPALEAIGLDGEAWDGNAVLAWHAVTPPADRKLRGYNVFRSQAKGDLFNPANQINDLPLASTKYMDTSATPGLYYYGVQAIWSDGSLGAQSEALPLTIN